jgi:hypothetical protein
MRDPENSEAEGIDHRRNQLMQCVAAPDTVECVKRFFVAGRAGIIGTKGVVRDWKRGGIFAAIEAVGHYCVTFSAGLIAEVPPPD